MSASLPVCLRVCGTTTWDVTAGVSLGVGVDRPPKGREGFGVADRQEGTVAFPARNLVGKGKGIPLPFRAGLVEDEARPFSNDGEGAMRFARAFHEQGRGVNGTTRSIPL